MSIDNLIQLHKDTVGHKINIPAKEIYEIKEDIKELLRPKYKKQFYFYEDDMKVTFNIKDDEATDLRCTETEFFGNDYVYLFGVHILDEIEMYNIVQELPDVFDNIWDEKVSKLKARINKLNDNILIELNKIQNFDLSYKDIIDKNMKYHAAKDSFNKQFKNISLESNIVKKSKKKLNSIFDNITEINSIELLGIDACWDEIEFGIQAKVPEFVYDSCLSITFKKDWVYLGALEYKNDKFKFEPNIKNSKYFRDEISGLGFLRNTFKKYLVEIIKQIDIPKS